MNIPTLACELPDAAPGELVEQPFSMPDLPQACIGLEASLARRLAEAKARLDRLEHEIDSRDLSALATARVEFALASRAMADELIARGLHALEIGDRSRPGVVRPTSPAPGDRLGPISAARSLGPTTVSDKRQPPAQQEPACSPCAPILLAAGDSLSALAGPGKAGQGT